MKKFNANKFEKIYSIVLSIYTCIVGCLFIYHILVINNAPSTISQKFTLEIVSKHLFQMLIPIFILILMIIGGYILSLILKNNNKNKISFYCSENVNKLLPKINLNSTDNAHSTYINDIKKYLKNKIIIKVIIAFIGLLCLIFASIYMFNKNNFSSANPLIEAINMALYLLPFIVVFFGILIAYVLIEEKLSSSILPSIKKLYSLKVFKNKEEKKKLLFNEIMIVRLSILVLSVTFIIIGISNGDVQDVLKKAITICSECIGLG